MPISDECTKNIFNLSLDFLYTFRSEINLTKFTDFCLKNHEPNSYFHGCSALLLCCSKANYIKIPCIFSVYCKNSQKIDILRVIKWYN